jgi:hypothetical protein
MSMKNSSDTIGNQTRDLPAYSAVPQPTAPLVVAVVVTVVSVVVVVVVVVVEVVVVVNLLIQERLRHTEEKRFRLSICWHITKNLINRQRYVNDQDADYVKLVLK